MRLLAFNTKFVNEKQDAIFIHLSGTPPLHTGMVRTGWPTAWEADLSLCTLPPSIRLY